MSLSITIPTAQDFWAWLARFAYRRWAKPVEKMPMGIPGNRDPDAPCAAFAPRPKRSNDFGDCQTDGHYLCGECCHKVPEQEPL